MPTTRRSSTSTAGRMKTRRGRPNCSPRGHPFGFTGAFNPEVATALQPVTRVLAAIGANLLQNTGHAEADIEPMAKAGVHIFGPMQDQRTYFNYHHAAADTLAWISTERNWPNAGRR